MGKWTIQPRKLAGACCSTTTEPESTVSSEATSIWKAHGQQRCCLEVFGCGRGFEDDLQSTERKILWKYQLVDLVLERWQSRMG